MIWLDNARISVIFAVVLLHVAYGVVIENDIGTNYWWFANIFDSSARWCVPVFVMISGALLLDSSKNEDSLTFYKKRLSRILLPVLFWSIFFLFWNFLKSKIGSSTEGVEFTDLLMLLLSGKPYYHMWFLYMIMGLYLFTPFFRKIAAHSTRRDLVILIIITFVLAAFNDAYQKLFSDESKLFVNWFLLYVPFFFLGHLIRQDESKPPKLGLWIIFVFSFISTFAGSYLLGLSAGLYFRGFLSITVIPMSISLMFLLKSWTKPIFNEKFTKKAALLTFGVYLIHPVALEIINFAGYGATRFHPLFSIPFITIVVFLSSLSVAWILHHVPYFKRTI